MKAKEVIILAQDQSPVTFVKGIIEENAQMVWLANTSINAKSVGNLVMVGHICRKCKQQHSSSAPTQESGKELAFTLSRGRESETIF